MKKSKGTKYFILVTVKVCYKVEILWDNPIILDIITCSIYNTKTFHISFYVADCIKWIAKENKIWNGSKKTYDMVQFLHLNIVASYNMGMQVW